MKKIRYIPYGYTMRNGRIVIQIDEASIIRNIFDAYIQGNSLQAIAQELTARKVPYTEKTAVWDKARIARIIDNEKYIGNGEYDPIIEETRHKEAVDLKNARQRNTSTKANAASVALKDRVLCAKCGAVMVKRVSHKKNRESWICNNADCGQRVQLSDTQLLEKVTILMNRIINNQDLLISTPPTKKTVSPAVQQLSDEIHIELERENPSEDLIITKTIEIANRMYQNSMPRQQIMCATVLNRAKTLASQKEFNSACFAQLIHHVILDENGRIGLYTKTETEVYEDADGSHQDT